MSASSSGAGARAVPFYCPYCGDEDLRPHEAKHGAWECRSCQRAFSLSMLGLLRPAASPAAPTIAEATKPQEAEVDR